MAWLVIALSLLVSAPALGAPATSLVVPPDDRAKQWMILVDDQNYADAYQQMGAAGRAKAADNWIEKIRSMRAPLGAMSSRTLKDVKMTKTLPGMRDGQFATVRYDTAFARKPDGVESVSLISENGAWSVIGYSIN